MKQNNLTVVVLKKIILVSALLSVVPFFGSAQAQNSGSQANLLLEVQALRQEVAELRDMVERQQYELKKIQTNSKQVSQQTFVSQNTPVLGSPRFEGDRAFQQTLPNQGDINDQVSKAANQLDASSPAISQLENAATANNSVVNTADNANPSSVVEPLNQSKSGREYAPVVEIKIASAQTELEEVDEGLVATKVIPSVPPLPDSNIVTSNNATQVLPSEAGLSQVVTQREAISISDIKPIETISPKSIVSIPTAPENSKPEVLTLDPESVVNAISEEDYYQQGFNFLKESKHPEAVAIFKKQINSYPKGDRADDAYYWVAESMYVNRKLGSAKENFKAIIQSYPKSERLPDAMLKLAYIEQEQGNIIESRILLQEILQFHPRSDAALSAKNRLAEIK